MKTIIAHPSLLAIFKKCSTFASLEKCSDKEYQKLTDHGKKLPNHNKHKIKPN